MSTKESIEYSAQEREARVQAALRGARSVGPRPQKIMTPKGVRAQRKTVASKKGSKSR